MTQSEEMKERIDADKELTAFSSGTRAASQIAAEKTAERLMNPNFLSELKKSGVNNELYDWIEEELGPELAGGHIVGQREEHYRHQQEWLAKNRENRMIVERTPGRLIRDKPHLLAVAQGVDSPDDPEFRSPIHNRPAKKRVIRGAHDVAVNLRSMSVGGYGLDSVTTATTEHRTVDRENEEKSGIASRAKRVLD